MVRAALAAWVAFGFGVDDAEGCCGWVSLFWDYVARSLVCTPSSLLFGQVRVG